MTTLDNWRYRVPWRRAHLICKPDDFGLSMTKCGLVAGMTHPLEGLPFKLDAANAVPAPAPLENASGTSAAGVHMKGS